MRKKLLRKTSAIFVMYSTFILVISAPVFYFIVRNLYLEEANDTLALYKKEFIYYNSRAIKWENIPAWNAYNRNLQIDTLVSITNDSLFSTFYYDTLDAENEPYRELNTIVKIDSREVTLKARVNLIESQDIIVHTVLMFIIVILFLLAGLFYLSRHLSRKLWIPFYHTLEAIEAFEVDKNKLPALPESDIEEFDRLNKSVQGLAQKNYNIYQHQREFIENAAHELQTPLAILKLKIEALVQRRDINSEQAELLAAVNENIFRLGRLNKNLLLLSKIENDFSYKPVSEYDINSVIAGSLSFFKEQAEAKKISVTWSESMPVSVRANPVLTEILINNLLMNAIRHNLPGGTVMIRMEERKLIISNTGHEHALNKEELFRRFYKQNPSATGNGLGLSIIKKIADVYGWKIDYDFSSGIHTFSVLF